MKYFFGSLILSSLFFFSTKKVFANTISNPPETKPNVLFFLVDDLGWMDVGYNGSDFYETPNIDALANEGVRFMRAYAASCVCSPIRSSILIGKHPARTKHTDYFGAPQPFQESHPAYNSKGHPLHSEGQPNKFLPAKYIDRVALEEVTIAEELKNEGYQTFFAGKWHLGPKGYWPTDQGFDVNKGGTAKGGPWKSDHYFSPYGNPNLENGPKGEYLPLRLASETNQFIAQNKEKPFFAYLSFYSVHTPLMTTVALEKKYDQKRKIQQKETYWGREGDRMVRLNQTHAVYSGMVEAMDKALGMVIDNLKKLDLYENTIIFLMSDNGGLSTSEGYPTANIPLRGGKGWLYEGGIREPMIIRWPQVSGGGIINTPETSHDFYPTILEILQLKPASNKVLDGVSLVPILKGKDLEERPLFWHYPHYSNQGTSPVSAIQKGGWKLIYWYCSNQSELYNLSADIGERNNLMLENPQKASQLKAELDDWLEEIDANMPIKNPEYSYE